MDSFVYDFFHSAVCVWDSFILLIYFYCWAVFHCMNKPQYIYLSSYWWAFGLFLVLSYYEKVAVNILVYFCVCVSICFHFSWVNSGPQGRYMLNFIITARHFCNVILPFSILTNNVWGLSLVYILTRSWCCQSFFFFFTFRHSDRYKILKVTPVFLGSSFIGHRNSVSFWLEWIPRHI